MAEKAVLYQRLGRIGRVTLNNTSAGNVIDDIMAHELRDACRQALEDDEAYVVVLTSAGASFCSGSATIGDSDTDLETTFERRRVADAVAAIHKPVIGFLQGDVLGQGLELALACDIRIAAQGSRFAMDQINQGQIPWDGGTQRLPRFVPRGVAVDLILTGRILEAEEALQAGLINAAVADSDLERRGLELAESIAAMAPIASAYAKETVHKGLDMTLEQGIRLEADLAILLHSSKDRAEGIDAFLRKRRASFTGE